MPSDGLSTGTDDRPPMLPDSDEPADRSGRLVRWRGALGAIGAGLLVAASLPPWGWWPLAFVGIALLERLTARRPAGSRFRRGWWFGIGWFAPGMAWMWFLTAPGYLFASALYATFIGVALAAAPGGDRRLIGLPAAITVVEAIRFSFPFGGVPLASLGISQVAGPLAGAARIGGVILITWLTLQLGVTLGQLAGHRQRATLRTASIGVAAVVLVVVAAAVAPAGTPTGDAVRVAIVQGGGPQGTRGEHRQPCGRRATPRGDEDDHPR